jgi:hypothetical protein
MVWKYPASHGMHATEATDGEYRPGAHMVHAEPLATDARPAKQPTHTMERSVLYDPVEQRKQADCALSAEKVPAAHAVHAVEPAAALYVPALHTEHVADPFTLMKPRGQITGCGSPDGQNQPAGHMVHAEEPAEDAKEPAGHTVHEPAATPLKNPTGHSVH